MAIKEGGEFLKYLKQYRNGEKEFAKQELKQIYEGEYTRSKPQGRRKGTSFSRILNALYGTNRVQVVYKKRRGNHSIIIGSGEELLLKSKSAVDQHMVRRKGEKSGTGKPENFPDDGTDPDLQTKSQRVQMLLLWIKTHRDILVEDKCDVEVVCEEDAAEGHIRIAVKRNKRFSTAIVVRNSSRSQDVLLCRCEMLWKKPVFTLSDRNKVTDGLGRHRLQPGEEYHITVSVRPIRGYGRHFVPVVLQFRRHDDGRTFYIARFLSVEVADDLTKSLGPTSPYRPPPRAARVRQGIKVVEGHPPDMTKADSLKMVALDTYPVPGSLRLQINRGDDLSDAVRGPLHFSDYAAIFSTLLHIEEVQMEVDIRRYDMRGVVMRRENRLMSLQVPGLAENRPSVLKGDHLFAQVRFGDRPGDVRYKGYVHHVEMLDVKLGFGQKLLDNFIKGMTFDVQFTFNRLSLRLQHRSLQLVRSRPSLGGVLFPDEAHLQPPDASSNQDMTLRFYNRKLEDNVEQSRAVRCIVGGSSRPAPYLVFGPPGTGKTVTLVEAIKQVYTVHPDSVILACAPSNSAADLLAQRLLTTTQLKPHLFRMNAASRLWRDVPEDLKDSKCCNYDPSTGQMYYPSLEELVQKYRVIVTTLVTAGRLASANFPTGHFTHIFIDESGHAVEPEAVIPVSGLLSPELGGQLVLAGDPKQLGPVLRSPVAIEHGLATSLLERLMTQCPLYQRGEDGQYDSRVLTKLVRNYRSHPAILEKPNNMFYDGELEVHADQLVREAFCQWEELPKKNFPVIFHGVEGVDEREGSSPSFFNVQEVAAVADYVEKLLQKRGGIKVKEDHIGIISPYRRQVQKIRQALKLRRRGEIKVGSVEEFQGQERLVIIVSTVRSTRQEYLKMDKDYNLGFLNNPKRFNVAITRAKALLIVVGNPYTLTRDGNWRSFLKYCKENGGVHPEGCDLPSERDEVEDILQRLDALNIGVTPPENEADDTPPEDPEWRRGE
ncbi:putative helicase MOV-10 [Branchiostoma floridae x Branchiostoma japonicum]